jgi:isocitrate dehydrogenase
MQNITVARGDGIGPEIMQVCLDIMNQAGAKLQIDEVEIGEKAYLAGHSTGITAEALDLLTRNKVFLKAPITTPQGGGYKSLNVTTRKMLGLFANVRPCRSLHPFIHTKHPQMDLVIIRENEEDLYAGIEYQQTDEVIQCLKLISRPGCEKIVRYAFEYAKINGRKKVTCFSKDNIMKQTDGLFHRIFNEIGEQYPDIEKEHWIIDIGAAMIADAPERFDVIVTLNLYGDIISDIAAQITGSVGMGGSANIGEEYAMFEAIHGSAPTIAGQNIANPSGLLQAGIMMLEYIGQGNIANIIHNAWLRTIEQGIHTPDIFIEGVSRRKVTTTEFSKAIIDNLGKKPEKLKAVSDIGNKTVFISEYKRRHPAHKQLVGVDLYVHWNGTDPEKLALIIDQMKTTSLRLSMITNRGINVWPGGFKGTFCTDHWRCRFISQNDDFPVKEDVISLLQQSLKNNIDIIKTENLYLFDGKPVY